MSRAINLRSQVTYMLAPLEPLGALLRIGASIPKLTKTGAICPTSAVRLMCLSRQIYPRLRVQCGPLSLRPIAGRACALKRTSTLAYGQIHRQ